MIICFILPINIIIALFKDKRITKKNVVITIIIIIICSILIVVGEKRSEQNEIPENVERAELQIELSKLVLKYGDEHGIGELTAGISDDLVPEVIKFESYDYDVTINDYKIEDGKLIINQVPVGNCGIELKFQNYDLISEKYKLNKKDLKNGKWIKNIALQEEGNYKNFQIQLVDLKGNFLEEKRCDIYVDGYNDKITDMVTDEYGKIAYKFTCKVDNILYLILHVEEKS